MQSTIPVSKQQLQEALQRANLLTPMVQDAFEQADKSHGEQTTKDGSPYLTNHLYPVVFLLLQVYEGDISDAAVATALLHDVVEDDPDVIAETLAQKFPESVVSDVATLSRQPEAKGASREVKAELTKTYMQKISNSNYDVRIVKLCDRLVNLYLADRIAAEKPDFVEYYHRETRNLFLPLAQKTSKIMLQAISDKLK